METAVVQSNEEINKTEASELPPQEPEINNPMNANDSNPKERVPQLSTIQRIMQNQHARFTQQLTELHRLIAVQKELTGIDPLTGKPVPRYEQQQLSLSAAYERTSNPTETQITSLATNLQMREDEVRHYFEAKNKQRAKPIKKEETMTPLQKQLASMIDSNNGLASVSLVSKMEALMLKEKDSSQQSLLLTVLCSTKDKITLQRLVETDTLGILNSWLVQAKLDGSIALIRQILKVLEILPVSLKSLKSSQIGKTVQKLKQIPNQDIVEKSKQLITKWKSMLSSAPELSIQAKEINKKRARDSTQKKPDEKVATLSSSDVFESELTATASKRSSTGLAPDYLKAKKHKMQMLDSTPLKKPVGKASTDTKPLSNDEIRKAKKQKALLTPEDSSKEVKEKEVKEKDIKVAPKRVASKEDLKAEIEIVESIPPAVSVPGKPKKRVSWSPKLTAIREFVKDEEEMLIQHGTRNFQVARLNDLKKERELRTSLKVSEEEEVKRKAEEMTETIAWSEPQDLELNGSLLVSHGKESKQVQIQIERESKELQAIYMNLEQIPESPIEAPMEAESDDSKIPEIPFELPQRSANVSAPNPLPFSSMPSQTPPLGFASSASHSVYQNVPPINPMGVPMLSPQLSSLLQNPELMANLSKVAAVPSTTQPNLNLDLIQTALLSNPNLLSALGVNPLITNAFFKQHPTPGVPMNVANPVVTNLLNRNLGSPALPSGNNIYSSQPQLNNLKFPQTPYQNNIPPNFYQMNQQNKISSFPNTFPQQQPNYFNSQEMPSLGGTRSFKQENRNFQGQPFPVPQGERRYAGSSQGNSSMNNQTDKKPCTFFNTAKGCRFGASCNFSHDLG